MRGARFSRVYSIDGALCSTGELDKLAFSLVVRLKNLDNSTVVDN
jgi:hypothetical protein